MSMSAAICIYNDFDFIEECIGRIYDAVDEIVILDGPYAYCEPILKEFDLYYEEAPAALRRIIALEKVRYAYGTFENETAKRVTLYEMCRCDIVMLLDSDELVTGIDPAAIAEFAAGPLLVASARIHNHVRSAVLIDEDKRKYIFFKRRKVSAAEHLNYTWLVGVEQSAPDQSIMFHTPLMEIAHLTLMRSPYFNLVKYCFYTRLYFYSREKYDELDRLFGIPFAELASCGLTYEQIKEIFRHSTPALVNFTEAAPLYAADGKLDAKYDDVLDVAPITEASEILLLGRVDSYHYLDLPRHLKPGDEVHFSCLIENIEALEVTAVLHNGQECQRMTCTLDESDGQVLSGRFSVPFATAGVFGALIHFRAPAARTLQAGRITGFIIKKHAAIYGNCQTENLRDFLLSAPAFNRRFVFEPTPGRLAHMMTPDDARELHGIMHRVDFLITQPIDKSFRGDAVFGTQTLLAHVRDDARVLMMPNLFFTGYAPEAYCVTYRKKFMQSPMPIHDVNMIYSFVGHRGDREAIKSDYVRKLLDEGFYKDEVLEAGVRNNIGELRRREMAAAESYPGANIWHFSYSDFLAAHLDKALLHYSDAHPTEYVFTELARLVLRDLGIEDDLVPPVLGEKGVLPFYNAVGKKFGFDAVAQPIMINNRQLSFNEFFDMYCDAYDGIEANELFGYIAGHAVKVIVTNHKTGTVLMTAVLRKYCQSYGLKLLELNDYLSSHGDRIDPAHDFQGYDFILATHAQHFEQLVTAVPYLRYRALHLIRHPIEIIMSGVRYHQITGEAWCNKKLFVQAADGICGYKRIGEYDSAMNEAAGDFTYREIMCALPARDRIEFEIRNHGSAFGTIQSIVRFLGRFGANANVSTIHLEDVASAPCIAHVFAFLNLREEFLPVYKEMVGGKEWQGRHVTNRDGGSTYQAAFDAGLYDLFAQEFGAGALAIFGYAPDDASAPYMRAQEADADLRRFTPVQPDSQDGSHAYATALFRQGDRRFAQGDLTGAVELLLQALELAPGEPGTLGRLGDIYVRLGQFEQALEYYALVEALPMDRPAWLDIGIANARRGLAQQEEAEVKVVQAQAAVLLSQGEALQAQGDLAGAKELFLHSLELAPREAGTLGRLGDICVRLRRFRQAIGYYRRVEALPMAKPDWVDIGMSNARRGLVQKEEAEAKGSQASSAALFKQGEALQSEGDLEGAKDSFLHALELAPRDVGTMGRLGDICVRLGAYEEAIVFYRRIEELMPARPAWLYIGLANAYESLARKAEAAENIRLALSLGATGAVLSDRLAALERDVSRAAAVSD